jgi:GTP pyrophosphokinase
MPDEAHLGQLRNNGEPYITHPIAVAAQCADWKLDAQALIGRTCCTTRWKTGGITKVDLIETLWHPSR